MTHSIFTTTTRVFKIICSWLISDFIWRKINIYKGMNWMMLDDN